MTLISNPKRLKPEREILEVDKKDGSLVGVSLVA